MALIHRNENKALFHVYDHFVFFNQEDVVFSLSIPFYHKLPAQGALYFCMFMSCGLFFQFLFTKRGYL